MTRAIVTTSHRIARFIFIFSGCLQTVVTNCSHTIVSPGVPQGAILGAAHFPTFPLVSDNARVLQHNTIIHEPVFRIQLNLICATRVVRTGDFLLLVNEDKCYCPDH